MLPLLMFAGPSEAKAQPGGDAAGSGAAAEDHPAGASPIDAAQPDDIVVTAERYGEAVIAAETELGEDQIAAYGADSIAELIKDIAPLANGAGGDLVILVNGERIGNSSEISIYPPEVLNRLAILPPEAAARYGYPAGQRVVNLVLKKKFANWQGEGGLTVATAGGRRSDRMSVGRFVIQGPTRWNVQLQVSRDSALLKSERTVPSDGGPIDLAGHIVAVNGGEIDPALSALAGAPVTSAAIPPGALFRAPLLADFVATANAAQLDDPGRYETLLPSGRRIGLNIGATRRLGSFNASLGLNVNSSRTRGLFGIPMTSIAIPAGSPWSPFANDVMLIRGLAGERALQNSQVNRSVGLSFTLSGAIGDWQTSFTANYSRNWTRSSLERGIDVQNIQGMIDAHDPAFNPYGPWQETLLRVRRNRSRGENIGAQLNMSRPLIELPAGRLTTNLSVRASISRSHSRLYGDVVDSPRAIEAEGRQLNGQLSFNIPLLSRSRGPIKILGDASADFTISGDVATGAKLRRRYGGALNWSPFVFLQLRGSFDYQQMFPSFDQLNGPRIESVNRIYDFAKQEFVEPIWITGGNPELKEGSRQSLLLSGVLRPFNSQIATFNFGYRKALAKGGTTSFPELTPIIEAAFPERIARDASGRLVAIDARAINIAHESSSYLATGVTLQFAGGATGEKGGARADMGRDPLQFSVSLTHGWQLTNQLLVREGVPVIDYLDGDGGQSRHNISLQIVAGRRGLGANLTGNWNSAARLRDPAAANGLGDFRYKAWSMFNLGLFIEPEHLGARAKEKNWLSNLKISLDIDNLLAGYRRVTLGDGSTPAGYSRDEVDPLGRTIRLSIRKRF